jgi:excisionase family DNA binding protein
METQFNNGLTLMGLPYWTKKVLTFEEAASYSGYSESYWYKVTAARKIAFYKPLGKLIFFLRTDVEDFLLQNRMAPDFEIEAEANAYVSKRKK